jgi:hypothetical protein
MSAPAGRLTIGSETGIWRRHVRWARPGFVAIFAPFLLVVAPAALALSGLGVAVAVMGVAGPRLPSAGLELWLAALAGFGIWADGRWHRSCIPQSPLDRCGSPNVSGFWVRRTGRRIATGNRPKHGLVNPDGKWVGGYQALGPG